MKNKEEAFRQLELFKNEYGIEVLEDFIKQQKKPSKRQRGRKPSGLITGASVYYEMFGLKIDDDNTKHLFANVDQKIIITEAKENIANYNGTTDKTVDKQVGQFNKYAKEMNYESFCVEFDQFKNNQNYEEWNENDYEGLKNHILSYANEQENFRTKEITGDYRYRGIDIRLAIALYLKYKYVNTKNAHLVPKKTEPHLPDLPDLDIPF